MFYIISLNRQVEVVGEVHEKMANLD